MTTEPDVKVEGSFLKIGNKRLDRRLLNQVEIENPQSMGARVLGYVNHSPHARSAGRWKTVLWITDGGELRKFYRSAESDAPLKNIKQIFVF